MARVDGAAYMITWLVFLTYCMAPVLVIPTPDMATCESMVPKMWRGGIVELAGERGAFSVITCVNDQIPVRLEHCLTTEEHELRRGPG